MNWTYNPEKNLKGTLNEYLSKTDLLEDELSKVKYENDKKDRIIQNLQAKIDSFGEKHMTKFRILSQQNDELKSNLRSYVRIKEENTDLKKDQASVRQDLENEKLGLAEVKELNMNLKSELEELKSEFKSLSLQHDTQLKTIKDLEDKLDKAHENKEQLEKKARESIRAHSDVNTKLSEVTSNFEQKVKSYEMDCELLKKTLSTKEVLYETAKAELQKEKAQVSTLEKNHQELNTKLVGSQAVNEELKKETQRLSTKYEDLSSHAQKNLIENGELRAKIGELTRELSSTKTKIDEVTQKSQREEQTSKTQTEQITTLKTENESLKDQIKSVELLNQELNKLVQEGEEKDVKLAEAVSKAANAEEILQKNCITHQEEVKSLKLQLKEAMLDIGDRKTVSKSSSGFSFNQEEASQQKNNSENNQFSQEDITLNQQLLDQLTEKEDIIDRLEQNYQDLSNQYKLKFDNMTKKLDDLQKKAEGMEKWEPTFAKNQMKIMKHIFEHISKGGKK